MQGAITPAITTAMGLEDAVPATVPLAAVHREALDLRPHPVPDDAAVHGCGWPAALEVRVTYSATDFPERRGPMLAASSDLVAVINAIRPPAAWASFAFEITPDANEAQAEPVYGADGNVTGAILTIPVLAEWEV